MTANAANPAGGTVQAPGPPSAAALLQSIANDCDKSVSPTKDDGSKKTCTKLGADKHACCEKAIEDHRNANPPDGDPKVEGERGYRRPSLTDDNQIVRPVAPLQPTGFARPNLGAAFAAGPAAVGAAFAALRGNCFPDAAIINADGSRQFVDFKFPCPPGHPTGGGRTSRGGANTAMSPRQQASYDALGQGSGNGNAFVISPT